jgi:hypothetical protein
MWSQGDTLNVVQQWQGLQWQGLQESSAERDSVWVPIYIVLRYELGDRLKGYILGYDRMAGISPRWRIL